MIQTKENNQLTYHGFSSSFVHDECGAQKSC